MILCFVRVCVRQYREELVLNIISFVVRVWGLQYSEELILIFIVFFLSSWEGNIEKN